MYPCLKIENCKLKIARSASLNVSIRHMACGIAFGFHSGLKVVGADHAEHFLDHFLCGAVFAHIGVNFKCPFGMFPAAWVFVVELPKKSLCKVKRHKHL